MGGCIVMGMARTEIITDDITGEHGAMPVRISIDDKSWTIDLTKSSRAKLDQALRPFLAKATPGGTSQRTTRTKKAARSATTMDASDRAQVRDWAAKNKVALPSRGRIPGAVIEQFRSATAKK